MEIPSAFFDIYNSTASDFITNNFGVPCELFYESNALECINCIFNPITKSSSGIYKVGGPLPFVGTICGYCNSTGRSLVQQTESILMRVYFTKKDFVKTDMPINMNSSTIQTIGFITDLPKLLRAHYIIVNTNVEGYSIYRYQLAGEIIVWGLGPVKKFCVAYWNRSQ